MWNDGRCQWEEIKNVHELTTPPHLTKKKSNSNISTLQWAALSITFNPRQIMVGLLILFPQLGHVEEGLDMKHEILR